VRFDLVWRHANGVPDTLLATWDDHFEPLPGGVYDAQPFERDVSVAMPINTLEGDQFVWRYSGLASTALQAYIPNGDGRITDGRIPNITLPKLR
jgi:hypothetical protein